MGMTIAEKIIAAAAGVDSVKPGDIYTVSLDHLMSNDGTTHLTVDMYNNKLKNPHIADTKKLVLIVDHNVPSDSPKTAASQKKMRDFARENNIDFWEGKGVCHQIMIENYVRPGQLIFGADSHTCSYGALGAFGTGVGCTDFLYGMVTGTSWVMVPETVKFNLTGKLPEGVYARDLILTIIGEIGANGCNYQAMEFTGEGARTLSISDRMALCNMAVEAGAKTGTAETGIANTNNGVFVCFAPYDDPQIAVAVVIEKGGSGAALASTAVDIVNSYFSQEEIGAVVIGENILLK